MGSGRSVLRALRSSPRGAEKWTVNAAGACSRDGSERFSGWSLIGASLERIPRLGGSPPRLTPQRKEALIRPIKHIFFPPPLPSGQAQACPAHERNASSSGIGRRNGCSTHLNQAMTSSLLDVSGGAEPETSGQSKRVQQGALAQIPIARARNHYSPRPSRCPRSLARARAYHVLRGRLSPTTGLGRARHEAAQEPSAPRSAHLPTSFVIRHRAVPACRRAEERTPFAPSPGSGSHLATLPSRDSDKPRTTPSAASPRTGDSCGIPRNNRRSESSLSARGDNRA